jgi:8-oxo-dGTP diphosphatase
VPLLLIRHASAGSRDEWVGDDRQRPLDERGIGQAEKLVEALADLPIDRILTSPFERCVATVEPLGAARGLVPELCDELGEQEQFTVGSAFVRSLAGADVAVCGHGGLEQSIPDPPRFKKAMVLVVGDHLELLDTIRV